jgi:hypothetical protein
MVVWCWLIGKGHALLHQIYLKWLPFAIAWRVGLRTAGLQIAEGGFLKKEPGRLLCCWGLLAPSNVMNLHGIVMV